MISTDIPLFPLHTVLFPGGHLPLRIFERRYLDMVRECSARGACFGVCLIDNPQGSERPASHLRLGTTARICDFSTLSDGLLGITARGEQKFLIHTTRMRDNGLLMGQVELLQETCAVDLPERYSILSMIAGRFMEQMSAQYPDFLPHHLQDSHWVGYRLAELLPMENEEKQLLLQISDPLERLQVLIDLLPRFQGPADF